ncbi:MAG: hypothetical protein QOH12_1866 [Solirubrobacteraceae bacterium]|jgi:conjugative relaxase-like TrwC/TraI family protein|nr:hypothetical protein [Solirubrobacteraceae bacterium]
MAFVLTVAKVTAGGGAAYAAYLEGRAQAPEQGDYYLKDGERVEAPGRWALGPPGAAALGLDRTQPVDGEAFHALMAVRHPVSGEPLRRVGANGEAVVAIDATFSAPKSVSAVWALGSPEIRTALESAQERAVDRALAHATEFVPMVRRRLDKDTVVRERAREVLASSWQHTTARAVAGRPPDPQLHSHLLIHGALRSDGRVVAVESRAWMVHQRETGAAYRAQLAHELRGLGFEVERATGRGRRYFELVGVPWGLRERWSSRHQQVAGAIEARLEEKRAALRAEIDLGGPGAADAAGRLDALERSGRLMPAEERRFAISSRAAKGSLATAGDLDWAWWETAVEHGFDARSVEALRGRGEQIRVDHGELERDVLGRLTEFDATFAPREARAAALEAAADLGHDAGLAALAGLQARGEVLDLADGRQTTRAHRVLERATVASATDLAGGRVPAVDPSLVTAEVDRLAGGLARRGGELAPEQRRAVELACGDRQLVVIVGQAGTGKSTALQGVTRAHQHAGRRVVVASTGAQAAERLAGELRDAGVDGRGYSTAALRANVESGRLVLDRGVTVLHDEAALASTREQAWLFRAVRESGARLVEIGDPRQSQAVGAGGLWSTIENTARGEGGFVELSRIVRAQDPADRRDQAVFRSGQHQRAVAGYAERGLVVFADQRRRAEDLALDAAQADRAAGRSTLVVAETSNEQLDGLNARAQAIRLQEGELGAENLPLTGRPYGLHAGDQVIVRAGVHHPDLGAVRNGISGAVTSVDPGLGQGTLRLSDGRQGTFDRELLDRAQTRLAYVSHPFPAQGQTTDTTHVIAGPQSTAEGSYVALTRARARTHVYAARDELDLTPDATPEAAVAALATRLGRSEPEMPSIRIPLAHEQRIEREHARAASSGGLDRAAEQLAQLRSERDRLRAVVATFPTRGAGEAEALARDVERCHDRADRMRAEAERLRAELDGLGPFARRGQRGQQIRVQLGLAEGNAAAMEQAARGGQARLDELNTAQGSPARWEAEHPRAREELREAERAFNRAVEHEASARIESPGEHVTRVLGPRPEPAREAEAEVWDKAAHAIEAYRIVHRVDPAEASALGSQPEPRHGSATQRRDWRSAGENVLKAREQLGIARQGYGSHEERVARVEGLLPERDRERALDRGHGFEL